MHPIKHDYASEHPSTKPNSIGPKQGGGGVTGWATPGKTRGHKASGRTLRGCESTCGGKTKLASLKR